MTLDDIKRQVIDKLCETREFAISYSDIHDAIDYLHSRGYFDGVPDGYVAVPKCTVDKLTIAEKALAQITVYDLFDCSSVEDTDFQEQAKMVYEIAETALKDMIEAGGK